MAKSSGCIRTPISVPLPVAGGPLRFSVITVCVKAPAPCYASTREPSRGRATKKGVPYVPADAVYLSGMVVGSLG